jgi:hypothetical protein
MARQRHLGQLGELLDVIVIGGSQAGAPAVQGRAVRRAGSWSWSAAVDGPVAWAGPPHGAGWTLTAPGWRLAAVIWWET